MYLVSSTRRRGSTRPGTVQNTPDAILGDFAMGQSASSSASASMHTSRALVWTSKVAGTRYSTERLYSRGFAREWGEVRATPWGERPAGVREKRCDKGEA